MVDPGDAAPVTAKLTELGLRLEAILVTHHHGDHVGGVDALRAATGAKVYGPAFETLPEPVQRVRAGDVVTALQIDFVVLEVPGHTAGHVAYFCKGAAAHPAPLLFCGDTLFSGGCGRLFEGTPEQMLASVTSLAQLPDNTLVCCAHEYTLSNLKFALAVDSKNQDLISYQAACQTLRQNDKPTLPSHMGLEKKINPFLRSHTPDVMASIQKFNPGARSATDFFAALREWKNNF